MVVLSWAKTIQIRPRGLFEQDGWNDISAFWLGFNQHCWLKPKFTHEKPWGFFVHSLRKKGRINTIRFTWGVTQILVICCLGGWNATPSSSSSLNIWNQGSSYHDIPLHRVGPRPWPFEFTTGCIFVELEIVGELTHWFASVPTQNLFDAWKKEIQLATVSKEPATTVSNDRLEEMSPVTCGFNRKPKATSCWERNWPSSATSNNTTCGASWPRGTCEGFHLYTSSTTTAGCGKRQL